MIVSTAKTGNTWLRHLLAAIYDLPMADFDFPFDAGAAEAAGARWITHQHYPPTPALLDWAKQNDVVLITTIRHPGDVLVSLYHYVRSYNDQIDYHLLAMLATDDGTFGEPVRFVVRHILKDLLAVSVDWVTSGAAHVVQYEALYLDPVAALTTLTDKISPVSRDCIERAVERCDIRVMRSLAHENRAFFRQGGGGGWRRVLPADIVELLRTIDPYPAQFAALGYSLAAQDAWSGATLKRPAAKADFFEAFGHSAVATALLKTIYLSFDSSDAQRRWPDIATAGAPTSFHAWLNAAAETDLPASAAVPAITNLAAHIHRARTDVRAAFPEPYGQHQHRIDYLLWLMREGAAEYQLDDAQVAPLRDSFAAWAARADAADAAQRAAGTPLLTNLAAYVYARRADVQAAFPEPYGRHRLDYLLWFARHAAQQYHVDESCVAPVRESLAAWAAQADAADAAQRAAGTPALTNLAAYVYARRADVRAAFPEPYGRHRLDYLLWLIEHAADEYPLDDACIAPLRQQFLAWAVGSGQRGGHGIQRAAYLTRYLLTHNQVRDAWLGSVVCRILSSLLVLRL
jgi:hypothetical protein